ncbi:hypothetical protein WICPIJ_005583 [Wickerhamomyces pijperi]|uniref:Uncharacterized protein n=1 Tax=Wickerhamomyces pijperi TaxID=599730 RepID=A0A9P8Q3J5_WICPI|nr:hypothetical protein WICPIJ_005583 [Wickerhamomyces pijperi]
MLSVRKETLNPPTAVYKDVTTHSTMMAGRADLPVKVETTYCKEAISDTMKRNKVKSVQADKYNPVEVPNLWKTHSVRTNP